MPILWHEAAVNQVSEYVQLFQAEGAFAADEPRWFRGEGRLRDAQALLPSLVRPPSTLAEEWAIYQRFRQAGAAFLPHTALSDWDWMLYMRHYGVKTRLLDWSESALVALYFAVEKTARDTDEGAVWVLRPIRLNTLAGLEPRVYCANLDEELDVYVSKAVKDAPVGTEYKPVALIAPRSFPRLVAQQGVFTVNHRVPTALDEIGDPELLARIRIPAAAKAPIRASLNAMRINRLSLYPELQSLGEAH